MAAIRKGNHNERAIDTNGNCRYKDDYGNHCFIGCFIPEGHPAEKSKVEVSGMLGFFPEIAQLLPFNEGSALTEFQNLHDDLNPNHDLYATAEQWLTKNVREAS